MNWRLLSALTVANTCGALAAVWTLQVSILGIDDAYIYLAYAKNFLLSGEFVYNLGGERVEGFSSPLWMLICIGAMWLSQEPQILLFSLGVALSTVITYNAVLYSEALLQDPEHGNDTFLHAGSWLFLAVLYANPSWFTWNIASLMETPLWGVLILIPMVRLLFTVRHGRSAPADFWLMPAILGMLALSRPEAPLWVCWFVLAWALALRAIGHTPLEIIRCIAPGAVVAAIATALLFSVRLSYFGYLFANTYYAKMSPNILYNLTEGLLYLLKFSAQNGIAVIGVGLAFWGLGKSIRVLLPSHGDTQQLRRDTELFLLVGTVAAGVVAALITGGDKFGGYRFYQAFIPMLYLLILYFCVHQWPTLRDLVMRPLPVATGIALAALTGLLSTNLITASWPNHNRTNLAIEFNIAEQMRLSARLMNHIFQAADIELPRVAVIPAGGFKLDSKAVTYDLMGLNLTAMAHSSIGREGIKNHAAFDPDVFWALEPQILGARVCRFESSPWADTRFEWRVLKSLPGSPRFRSEFSYAHLRVRGELNWLCGYMQNGLISELDQDPDLEIHTFEDHQAGSHSLDIAPEETGFILKLQ